MRLFPVLFGVLLVPLTTGHATSYPSALTEDAQARAKLPSSSLRVPLSRQETSYSCGAAVFLSVLKYWTNYEGTEQDLYVILNTSPEHGTHPRSLERAARAFGLDAELREGLRFEDLSAAVERGETVIIDIQAWPDDDDDRAWPERWDDGHYVIFMGSDSQYAYVMDPSTSRAYAYLPIAELAERWHDYEIEDGARREYLQAGVFIRGLEPQVKKHDTRRVKRLR